MERKVDLAVGLFMIFGIICLVYISVNFGELDLFGNDNYKVSAVFSRVGGLEENTAVEMHGIDIGGVSEIEFKDQQTYKIKVTMQIDRKIDLPTPGTKASVRTKGLLGEKYLAVSPGFGRENIPKDGTGKIRETEPPLIIEDLVSKFMFGQTDENNSEAKQK